MALFVRLGLRHECVDVRKRTSGYALELIQAGEVVARMELFDKLGRSRSRWSSHAAINARPFSLLMTGRQVCRSEMAHPYPRQI
jgi:hypothetical protein